ncbi:Alginate-lyase domain-containing protein [Mycena sanguinolenta]|uniref:Alginate-lyase domain-containing protein n=1 Tax=Mycena sanguinolenta TaxID=230812 RepID=A0A8H6XLS4_9AGAR|nr:Alginate-lyase domain-containing protein [Mycena sanguinolenta]
MQLPLLPVFTTISLLFGINTAPTLDVAPKTVVLQGHKLLERRTKLVNNRAGPKLQAAFERLEREANHLLDKGPWSVTDKKHRAPGAGIHDYSSMAKYYWPTNGGCPYVYRDGHPNPERLNYTDHAERGYMFNSSYTLSLAWYYTGDEKYARQAAKVLRNWFILKEKRMNPSINWAGFIPCQHGGTFYGIIDWSEGYTMVLDAVAILESTKAPHWTKHDIAEFKKWNTQFLHWLDTSEFGKNESAARNNHGIWALQLRAGIALFLGKHREAKRIAEEAKHRVNAQITPGGEQPEELKRSASFQYSAFALTAFTRLAMIARHPGVKVDLWRYKGPKGQSIQKAVDYLIPAATEGKKRWHHSGPVKRYEAKGVIHWAASVGNKKAKKAVDDVPAPPWGDLWPVRPAPDLM